MASLRTRMIFSHILPLLIVVPLIGLAAFLLLRSQSTLSGVESSLQQEADRLRSQVALQTQATNDLDKVLSDPAAARQFVSSVDLRVGSLTLVDRTGRIVASNDQASGLRIGESLSPERISALAAGQGNLNMEVVDQAGQRVAQIAIPILDADQQLAGAMLISQDLFAVQQQLGRTYWLLGAIVLVLLSLGVLLGLLLALRVSHSMQQVSSALQGVARGESPAALPEVATPEINSLYQSVNDLVDRLRALEEARKRLLANLVHELARPLGSMRSAVQALQAGAADDAALRQELLAGVDAQIDGMQPMLEDLTRLHGQVLGSLDLNRQPTPLTPWLRQIGALWRQAAQEKGVEWRADIPMNLPVANIDADQMARALGNLFSNAVKFTPHGGVIVVVAQVDQANETQPHAHCRIVVTDTGPGVGAEDQQRIFEPFQRGHGGRRFPQGMGLGLSIARDIVQAHNGAIELASEPGKGSRFTLRFPIETQGRTRPA